MSTRALSGVAVAVLALFSITAAAADLEPLTVSPGDEGRFVSVEARCPTFSWQAVPGATGYEVVVYRFTPSAVVDGWNLESAVEVLFIELPGGVTAWTPSLEYGLVRGTDHVWFVRAVMDDQDGMRPTGWSAARYFRVAGADHGVGLAAPEGTPMAAVADAGAAEGSSGRTGGDAATGGPAFEKRSPLVPTSVGTALAAIRGEMPGPTGEEYGVVGIANTLEGAGIAAMNLVDGPDLVLDGSANDSGTDTLVDQGQLDRPSPDPEAFSFVNSGGGGMTVDIDGAKVVTTLTDQDTLASLGCSTWQVAKWTGSQWACWMDWDTLYHLTCGPDEIAKFVTGAWTCATDVDTDTTYTSGTGLELVGTEFRSKGAGWGNVVVVAKSGGDFTSIQAAIDSIADESSSNEYLVWVAPGTYVENVTMKPYVNLRGAGVGAGAQTRIQSSISGSTTPPPATLTLASDTTVEDLTVHNLGTGYRSAAVLGPASGSSRLSRVKVVTDAAGGDYHYGLFVVPGSANLTLDDVEAVAANGTDTNFGLYSDTSGTLTVRGGTYKGQNGGAAIGISVRLGGVLDGADITVTGLNGSTASRALTIQGSVTLRGGTFTGDGGDSAEGISIFAGGALEAIGVIAAGRNGTLVTDGLNISGGTARLAYSLLDGGAGKTGGTLICLGVFDTTFAGYACP